MNCVLPYVMFRYSYVGEFWDLLTNANVEQYDGMALVLLFA